MIRRIVRKVLDKAEDVVLGKSPRREQELDRELRDQQKPEQDK